MYFFDISTERSLIIHKIQSDAHVWSLNTKLVLSDGVENDMFGYSVAVNTDTAIVSSYYGKVACVYVYKDNTWMLQTKLLPPTDGSNYNLFAYTAALDGNTAIVSAIELLDSTGSTIGGSAHVFERNGDEWIYQAKLSSPSNPIDDAYFDYFGWRLALDGNIAIVTAVQDSEYGEGSGAAYVFERTGESWGPPIKLLANDGALGDNFGSSVALSGWTAIIGALQDDGGVEGMGSAYVFVLEGVEWKQQAKLRPSDGAPGNSFGWSVAIDSSTNLAIISAISVGSDLSGSGFVYVFDWDAMEMKWKEQTKLVTTDHLQGDFFGYSVAVSGSTILVGSVNHLSSGSAYVFVTDGVTWTQQSMLLPHDGEIGDGFGGSVALDSSINTALVGAMYDDDMGGNSGSAYVFDTASPLSPPATRTPTPPPPPAAPSLSPVGTPVTPLVSLGQFIISGSIFLTDFDTTLTDDSIALLEVVLKDAASVNLEADQSIADVTITSIGGEVQGSGNLRLRLLQAASLPVEFELVAQVTCSAISCDDVTIVANLLYDRVKGSLSDQISSGAFSSTLQEKANNELVHSLISASVSSVAVTGVMIYSSWNSWKLNTKLTQSDPLVNGLGYNIVLDADTAVVGALDGIGAYVFVLREGKWELQSKLLPPSDGSDYTRFGWVAALDADIALVGALERDAINPFTEPNVPSVHVFERIGNIWTHTIKLSPRSSGFGYRLALSSGFALVSSVNDDDNGENSGAAYMFQRNNNSWVEHAKLKPTDGKEGDYFGTSVSLSGQTAIIAASGSGAAYVFTLVGADWIEQAKLTGDDSLFGCSVAIDNSAKRVIVGSNHFGYIFVLSHDGVKWDQQAKLDVGAADGLGTSVAISDNTALVGYPNYSGKDTVYVFVWDGVKWAQKELLLPTGQGNEDNFGWSVAIDSSIKTVFVGALLDDEAGLDGGSIYVFDTTTSSVSIRIQGSISVTNFDTATLSDEVIGVLKQTIKEMASVNLGSGQSVDEVSISSIDGNKVVRQLRFLETSSLVVMFEIVVREICGSKDCNDATEMANNMFELVTGAMHDQINSNAFTQALQEKAESDQVYSLVDTIASSVDFTVPDVTLIVLGKDIMVRMLSS